MVEFLYIIDLTWCCRLIGRIV